MYKAHLFSSSHLVFELVESFAYIVVASTSVEPVNMTSLILHKHMYRNCNIHMIT